MTGWMAQWLTCYLYKFVSLCPWLSIEENRLRLLRNTIAGQEVLLIFLLFVVCYLCVCGCLSLSFINFILITDCKPAIHPSSYPVSEPNRTTVTATTLALLILARDFYYFPWSIWASKPASQRSVLVRNYLFPGTRPCLCLMRTKFFALCRVCRRSCYKNKLSR